MRMRAAEYAFAAMVSRHCCCIRLVLLKLFESGDAKVIGRIIVAQVEVSDQTSDHLWVIVRQIDASVLGFLIQCQHVRLLRRAVNYLSAEFETLREKLAS